MLATLAALTILAAPSPAARVAAALPVLAAAAEDVQRPGPNPPLPDRKGHRTEPTRSLVPAAEPGEPAAPVSPPPEAPAAEAEPVPPEPPPAELPPRPAPPAAPPPAAPGPASLLSAESLRGGAAALAYAGWSSLGATYAQGITPDDDLGGFLDFDWTRTELRLGALYRRPVGSSGPWSLALRLGAAWYADFGATWIHSANRHDRGLQLIPGAAASLRAGGGVLSVLADAPLTATFWRGGGVLFAPRAAIAYEAPLYDAFTVGARAGLGWRGGSGGAPARSGTAELEFVLLAGWQLL